MNDREKNTTLSEHGDESERVLIVDDDPSMRTALMETVKRLGYSVQGAVDGMDALERITRFRPWMVLTDLKMPRLNGLELIKEIKARAPQATIVLMTAYGDHRNSRRGHEAGCERISVEAVFNGLAGASHCESQIGTGRRDRHRSSAPSNGKSGAVNPRPRHDSALKHDRRCCVQPSHGSDSGGERHRKRAVGEVYPQSESHGHIGRSSRSIARRYRTDYSKVNCLATSAARSPAR